MTIYQAAGCATPGAKGWMRKASTGSLPSRAHSLRGHYRVSEAGVSTRWERSPGSSGKAFLGSESPRAVWGHPEARTWRVRSHACDPMDLEHQVHGGHKAREGATDQMDTKGPECTP